jgi:hypothetical protein
VVEPNDPEVAKPSRRIPRNRNTIIKSFIGSKTYAKLTINQLTQTIHEKSIPLGLSIIKRKPHNERIVGAMS